MADIAAYDNSIVSGAYVRSLADREIELTSCGIGDRPETAALSAMKKVVNCWGEINGFSGHFRIRFEPDRHYTRGLSSYCILKARIFM